MIGELLVSKWTQVRADLLATMDKFADEELAFRPATAAYSAGELMLHVAHEESIEVLWGLARRFEEMPQAYDADAIAGVVSIKDALRAVHDESQRYFESLEDETLMSAVTLAWGEDARPVDTLWHVIEHEIHHRGELSLMLGLLGRMGLDA